MQVAELAEGVATADISILTPSSDNRCRPYTKRLAASNGRRCGIWVPTHAISLTHFLPALLVPFTYCWEIASQMKNSRAVLARAVGVGVIVRWEIG